MIETKIKLSAHELMMVQDAGLILTKNAIMQKVISIFSSLAENMQLELLKAKLPQEIKVTEPKISKGENYKGLPYVILDYPKLFGKENIFAIRILFWWGKYFTTTLHLKGAYKEMFSDAIRKNLALLKQKHFFISISNDEWKHEHDEENYASLSRITEKEFDNIVQKKPFLKISVKTALSEWDNCPIILMELFRDVLKSVSQF